MTGPGPIARLFSPARGEAGDPRRARRRVAAGPGFGLYCLVAMLIAMVAMQTGVNLLFWIFGVMAAAIVVGGVVSGSMMLNLEVRRLPSGRVVAGEDTVLQYAVRNRGRFLPAFGIELEDVPGGQRRRPARRGRREGREGGRGIGRGRPAPRDRDSEPAVQAAWVMHAGPGETVHGEAILRPRRRGLVRLERLRVSSTFPFGLLRKTVEFSVPQEILVLPRAWPLRPGVLRELAPHGATGTRNGRRSGVGDDFFGLRDHRPEDGLRNIAWKRTANRDTLLVVERTRPDPPRLRIAVNLTAPTDALGVQPDEPVDARGLEERAISLAASLVVAADHLGYEIGLSILGSDRAAIPVRRTARHRDRLLAELARIDLDLPRTGRVRLPAIEREGAALVVVHPARVEPDLVPAGALHYTARQVERLVEPGALERGGGEDHRAARRHERAADPTVDPGRVAERRPEAAA